MTEPVVRPLDLDGVRAMIAMAAAEGWNPGLLDPEAFHAADPDGFLGLFLDDPEPVAVVSIVCYDAAFAFLGLYICRPEHRGRGLGKRLWDAAIAHAGDRAIGLDGVLAQQANYARAGFVPLWRNVRYAGPAAEAAESGAPTEARIRPPGADEADAIAAYDRPLFGADRSAFLRRWLAAPGHRALVAARADGAIVGYGVVRPCLDGHKVGPLFADDAATAAALLDALMAPLAGRTVVLDVPEANPAAVALAVRCGWSPVFETARMVKGPAPAVPLARVFGITSYELG